MDREEPRGVPDGDQESNMKKSTKAALWSALVFPGAGQLTVGRRLRGLVFLGVFAALTWYLVDDILSRGLMDKANDLAYKILSGEVQPDSTSIDRALNLGPDPLSVQIASWGLFVCWVAGIVDAYRLGLRIDRAKPDTSPQTR